MDPGPIISKAKRQASAEMRIGIPDGEPEVQKMVDSHEVKLQVKLSS
jgi:hypothetical protein